MVSSTMVVGTTTLAWVCWSMIAQHILLHLGFWQNHDMLQCLTCAVELALLCIISVVHHVHSGQSFIASTTRSLFFMLILGFTIGPAYDSALNGIIEGGVSTVLTTTLPLMSISWAFKHILSYAPFKKSQACALAISLCALFWMYNEYKNDNAKIYMVEGIEQMSHPVFINLSKSVGVLQGFYFTVNLAQIIFMFQLISAFLTSPFDVITQLFTMKLFTLLYHVCTAIKYKNWDTSVFSNPNLLPYFVAYVVLDLVFISGLCLSVHPDHERKRYLLLLAPLISIAIENCNGASPLDRTMLIGGIVLFACAAVSEYMNHIEILANAPFRSSLPQYELPNPEALPDTAENELAEEIAEPETEGLP